MAKTILDPNEMQFTRFEPKVTNRFILYADGIPAFLVKGMSRPTIDNGKIEIHHINNKFNVKGKSMWDDVNMTLYDAIVPSAAQAIMEWVRLSHESVTGRNGYSDYYKKDLTFNVLGPVGDIIEEWTLKGAYVMNAAFNEMDKEDSTALLVNVTLAIDYAILQY